MKNVQLLSIEIGDKCNLSREHHLCPSSYRQKKDKTLTDDMIISIVKEAYEELGFTGYVAWHFYNEPLLYKKRMFALMKTLKETVKGVKFLLWTNGELLKRNKDMELFDRVVITNYKNRPVSYFEKFFKNKEIAVLPPIFDGRLNIKGERSYEKCLRPYIEFIISFYGDVHMCCQDWKNEIEIGNIYVTSLKELVKKRNKTLSTILSKMDNKSPKTCVTCNGRLPFLVRFFDES